MHERESDEALAKTESSVESPAEQPSGDGFQGLLRGDLRRAARAGAPVDPVAAGQLLRLQRSAGNAAVMRLLRAVAPPAEAPAGDAGAAALATTGVIVDDEAGEPVGGQMRRGEFLDQLHTRSSAVAERELGLLFAIAGCPWLDHWTEYFRSKAPAEIEAAIRRYAPAAAGATTAGQYLEAIAERVGQGIASWRETGELPPAPTPGEGNASAGGAAPAAGDAGVARTPSLLEDPGSPLDPEVGSRIGAAFGRDFSSVRVHDGNAAAGLAGRLSSRAVTVGRHVAFAPGEYEPGTPVGNALIAHELAHVVQQEGAMGVARAPATGALELDADESAASALLAWRAPHATLGRRVVPALRTGLTLQSCGGGKDASVKTFEDAIKVPDYDLAASLLAAEKDDAQILAKLKPLSADQLAKLDAAALKTLAGAADRVHRPISFLQNAPPPGTAHTDAEVPNAGVVGASANAGGGAVEARTGVTYKDPGVGGRQYDDGFSVGYKGPDANKTRWLQFIWREMVCEGHPVRGTYRLDEEIQSSAKNKYRWSADSAAPVYNTDSRDDTLPFYEAQFHDNRSADASTIYDMPGSFSQVVKRQFDAGATKVTSRAHFTTYLVKDMQVLQAVTTDIEWVFASADVEPPRKQTQAASAANALNPEMRKRLVLQYPKFDYLP